MLTKYQLIISDFYNIPIDNVKSLAYNFLDKKKYGLDCENLHLCFGLGLKLKTYLAH